MKECKKCNTIKLEEEFYKRSSGTKDGLYSYCIPCTKSNQKEYRQTETFKKGNNIRVKRWQSNHPVQHSKINRKTQKRFAKKLTDSYVIKQIKGRYNSLSSSQIQEYPQLIEAKRIDLKIKRLLIKLK
jgi:hypothetical protein